MAGLQEEVVDHVRLHDPRDLMTTMRLAREVEKLCKGSRTGVGHATKNHSSWGRTVGIVTQVETPRDTPSIGETAESVGSMRREATQGGNNLRTNGDGREQNTHNLPYSEYVKRREEGRCFRCGGPFSPAINAQRGDFGC